MVETEEKEGLSGRGGQLRDQETILRACAKWGMSAAGHNVKLRISL